MLIQDLEPGTEYNVLVMSKARHENQSNAWDRNEMFLCREHSPVITFKTGQPPIVPTEFSVIGGKDPL